MEMTGKDQTEAVSILRSAPLNSTVSIIVSRQVLDIPDGQDKQDKFAVPRELVGQGHREHNMFGYKVMLRVHNIFICDLVLRKGNMDSTAFLTIVAIAV